MTAIQTWWHVVLTFLKLSLFSIGGGNTLLQAYHHEVVDTFGWLTNRQFSDLYGLAEAAPGPSSMLVGLLGLGAGWKRPGPVNKALALEAALAWQHHGSVEAVLIVALSWKRPWAWKGPW